MTIAEFLLARIAEDEARARAASSPTWGYEPAEGVVFAGLPADEPCDQHPGQRYNMCDSNPVATIDSDFGATDADGEHMAAWDPARVLRECEAKRRIVALHSGQADTQWHECPTWAVPVDNDEPHTHTGYYQDPCETLANFAAVYADHPEYDPAWAVQ